MFAIDKIFIKGQEKYILSKIVGNQKQIIKICDDLQQAQNTKIAKMI